MEGPPFLFFSTVNPDQPGGGAGGPQAPLLDCSIPVSYCQDEVGSVSLASSAETPKVGILGRGPVLGPLPDRAWPGQA